MILWPDSRINAELDKSRTDRDDLLLMHRIRDEYEAYIAAHLPRPQLPVGVPDFVPPEATVGVQQTD